MPESRPIIPAQPNEARYGIEKLYTSPRLTRAIYAQLYGAEAPAYDPKSRIKRWFFNNLVSSDPQNTLVTVTIWDAITRTIRPMAMTEAVVSAPNLPGAVSWPKYVNPVGTPAIIVDPNGGQTLTMNGETLVDLVQAKAVLDEINAQLGPGFVLVPAGEPWPWKIVWGFEPRRKMNVTAGGNLWDAAAMLKNRFAAGLGSPGKWVDQGSLGPVFVSEVPNDGEQDIRPEIPMPCRPLLPNEQFATVTFGGLGGVIERTDLLPANSEAPGGGLTAEQDRLLRGIAGKLGVS